MRPETPVGRVGRQPRRPERRTRDDKRAGPTPARLMRVPVADARVGRGQKQVRDQAAEGEKQAAHGSAASHQVDVSRPQTLIHQTPEPRPCRDVLHDERA